MGGSLLRSVDRGNIGQCAVKRKAKVKGVEGLTGKSAFCVLVLPTASATRCSCLPKSNIRSRPSITLVIRDFITRGVSSAPPGGGCPSPLTHTYRAVLCSVSSCGGSLGSEVGPRKQRVRQARQAAATSLFFERLQGWNSPLGICSLPVWGAPSRPARLPRALRAYLGS